MRSAIEVKYNHHSAAVPRNAIASAPRVPASSSRGEVVVPVITIDSPRAMITKSWKRSTKCAVPTSQASGSTGAIHGTRKVTSGPP